VKRYIPLNENKLKRPQIEGNTIKAWMNYLPDYLTYLKQKYGYKDTDVFTYNFTIGDDFTKNGLKALDKLGIKYEIINEHLTGQPVYDRKKHVGWGGTLDFQTIKVYW